MVFYSDFHGIINLYKPVGVTSTDCTNWVKRLLNIKKVGHGGTLDPFAEGVLPIGINKGTKLLEGYLQGTKSYIGHVTCGYKTDTLDSEGTLESVSSKSLDFDLLNQSLKQFQGTFFQETPKFSARKIKGKRMYKLARQGIEIEERPKREVTIHSIKVSNFSKGEFTIEVECSKGTYIRQLISDIGKSLDLDLTLDKLIRQKVAGLQMPDSINHWDLMKLIQDNQAISGKHFITQE
ncbi:MAG: tRNA pseudouridine(55) synthase TruB [Candidatus Cloacimonetes bacterium]|nr:tRNA pseudouridine(55) synthase TruB [Candidatus Cloacimonadota bacterium]